MNWISISINCCCDAFAYTLKKRNSMHTLMARSAERRAKTNQQEKTHVP